jgi:hypothetical protein
VYLIGVEYRGAKEVGLVSLENQEYQMNEYLKNKMKLRSYTFIGQDREGSLENLVDGLF